VRNRSGAKKPRAKRISSLPTSGDSSVFFGSPKKPNLNPSQIGQLATAKQLAKQGFAFVKRQTANLFKTKKGDMHTPTVQLEHNGIFAVELFKQLYRTRTYLALGVLGAIPILITLALKIGGVPANPQGSPQYDFFVVATRSGLEMPLVTLMSVTPFLLVAVVAIFAGESVSGEASWGTLKYLLTRPVSRWRLLAAKLSTIGILSIAACIIAPVVGLVSGVIAFGWHSVVTPELQLFSPLQAIWRSTVATGYVGVEMTSVIGFSFMLSTMIDSPIGAIGGGVVFIIVSEILDSIPALKTMHDILPTHYWPAWGGLFIQPMYLGAMEKGIVVAAVYFLLTCTVAWWWFCRKDILS
jgi:ABC-2 type transport system permease protein